jgi:hypothetical protein
VVSRQRRQRAEVSPIEGEHNVRPELLGDGHRDRVCEVEP